MMNSVGYFLKDLGPVTVLRYAEKKKILGKIFLITDKKFEDQKVHQNSHLGFGRLLYD